jgi:type II secretory ATPase GspE/PulE/Tfp pilus assembly ATPase PilB-like protein
MNNDVEKQNSKGFKVLFAGADLSAFKKTVKKDAGQEVAGARDRKQTNCNTGFLPLNMDDTLKHAFCEAIKNKSDKIYLTPTKNGFEIRLSQGKCYTMLSSGDIEQNYAIIYSLKSAANATNMSHREPNEYQVTISMEKGKNHLVSVSSCPTVFRREAIVISM